MVLSQISSYSCYLKKFKGLCVFIFILLCFFAVSSTATMACTYDSFAYDMFPNSTCALDYGADPWYGDCFKCDLTVYCRSSCSNNVFYLETWDGSDCTGCSIPASCSYSSCNSVDNCVVNENQPLCSGGGCACYSNLCTLSSECKRPNLTCNSVVLSPANPYLNQTHTTSVTINNIGSAYARASSSDIFLDCNPQTSSCSYVTRIPVAGIMKGFSATKTFSGLTVSTTGSHTYYIKVDSTNAITNEKSEADNFCSAPFTVCNNSPPPAPTFTVSACSTNTKPTWTRSAYSYTGYCNFINKTKIIKSWGTVTTEYSDSELTSWTPAVDRANGDAIQVCYSNDGGATYGVCSAPVAAKIDAVRPFVTYLTPVTPTCTLNKRPTWSWTNNNSGCFTTNKAEITRSWNTANIFKEPEVSSWTPDADRADGASTITVRLYENLGNLYGSFSTGSTYNIDTTAPTVSGTQTNIYCAHAGQSDGSVQAPQSFFLVYHFLQ